MKTKNLIFIFGAALMVSFGVFCSPEKYSRVNADNTVNVGTIVIDSVRNQSSNSKEIYLIPTEENKLPDSWDYVYSPVGENDGIFVNGVKDASAYIKHADIGLQYVTFYVRLSKSAAKNAVVEIVGSWSSPTDNTTTYSFSFKKISLKRVDSTWEKQIELQPYDKISLTDTCFNGADRESFDTSGLVPSSQNTYVPSAENTTNSFSVEFEFEAYASMASTLTIRVGNSGPYDTGHFYKLDLNNTWGDNPDDPSVLGGVIVFYEIDEEESKKPAEESKNYRCADLRCNLETGRHTIEFGSVYVQDSTDTCNFVKYDGQYLYQEVRAPINNNRTNKVSYYYGAEDIYLGSTIADQKANDQTLQFNRLSEDGKGIYFDGLENAIPSGSDVKGTPLSKNNLLLNGKPMYNVPSNPAVMTKVSSEEDSAYYLNLTSAGVEFKEGDVITLSDEFRFFANDTPYAMSISPVSLLYTGNQFTQINIYTHLYNLIASHNVPEDYDADKLEEVVQIINDAQTNLPSVTNMKALWDMYFDYIAQISAIPYNAEKQQEVLNNAKLAAVAQLEALKDSSKYNETNYAIVEGYVNDAVNQINNETTDTVAKVQQIVSDTIELVDAVETIQQYVEKTIMNSESDDIPDEFLEDYEVVTTTDLCAVGSLVFRDQESGSYSSGGYDDTTTRIATSTSNPTGNMIFQFIYESDDPSARYTNANGVYFGSQVFIRMRSKSDRNAYRFDIATDTGEAEFNSGVALSTLKNDIAVGRLIYDAKLAPNTPYEIECGAINLDGGFNRTMLFMRINGKMVLKSIVDSLDDSQSTIRITDSYVKEGHTATLSPVEEGVTKGEYATLIGKPNLDEESNQNTLQVSLRNNNIPNGATLFPAEKGAFTINGNEIQSGRAATRIEKIGQNKYTIVTGKEIEDGDVVTIGGLYSVFNSTNFSKTIVKLFSSTFTYNAEADSWSQQEETDPVVIKTEAQETIKGYVDLSNYSDDNAAAVQVIINHYVAIIDEVTSTDDIPAIVEEALRNIDEINTLLDDYKEAAIKELTDYRSPLDYRDEERATLEEILTDAATQINNCNDQDSVDLIVQQTKTQIDRLKTSEERDAEDLASAKRQASSDIQAYASLLEMNRYSDANADLLTDMTYQALDDVNNATTIEQVNSIVATYKEDVKNVKTKDGSRFDGEKYIEKKTAPKKGCGGSIETVSMLSFVALFGAAVLLVVKKTKENRE